MRIFFVFSAKYYVDNSPYYVVHLQSAHVVSVPVCRCFLFSCSPLSLFCGSTSVGLLHSVFCRFQVVVSIHRRKCSTPSILFALPSASSPIVFAFNWWPCYTMSPARCSLSAVIWLFRVETLPRRFWNLRGNAKSLQFSFESAMIQIFRVETLLQLT